MSGRSCAAFEAALDWGAGLSEIAGWIAPVATMVAAVMTAANLGARITGFGFVVFLVGSLAWVVVAITSGQQNLLWTNGFLTVVNAVGIWRWLGRQARYEKGGAAAARRSASSQSATLAPVSKMIGMPLSGADGEPVGTVVEAMIDASDLRTAYLVVREGGVVGVGERLHAVSCQDIVMRDEALTCRLSAEDLRARTPLGDVWPVKAPGPAR
ncbi:MAG: PRC-barrel domain-containing protein [Caulobacter sp.]